MTALPDPPSSDPPPPDRVSIRFDPDGARPREVRVPAGATLFDAASWNGIAVDSTCGGHGTCKKCRMRVVEGDVPCPGSTRARSSPDELRAGWRLACRARAEQDLRVEVPPLVTRPKAATVGVGRQVILRPAAAEALRDAARADAVRPAHGRRTPARRAARPGAAGRPAGGPRPGPGAARRVDGTPADHPVTAVVVDDVLVDVEPGDTTERLFGIAFDLGTTTVVATLLDLATGTPVAVASLLNPQQPYGADVITRISATMMDPDALGRLTALAHEGLDQLAGEVCADGGVDRARGLRDRAGGQRHDDPPRAGPGPRAAGRRPVRHGLPVLRRPRRRRPRRRRAPAGPGVRVPGARRLRRRRHRRGRARVRDGPRPADPAVHRHRHELRDPARRRRPPARDGRARRAGVRGRGHPLRDAGRARARSRV